VTLRRFGDVTANIIGDVISPAGWGVSRTCTAMRVAPVAGQPLDRDAR